MLISFELTMPNRGSWNGQWSGQEKKYFVIRSMSKRFVTNNEFLKLILEKGHDNFYYRWSDGWGANVSVEIIDGNEAKKRRKISSGFCGYDWMISSIVKYGTIQTETDIKNKSSILTESL
jgi:hypothetical protein